MACRPTYMCLSLVRMTYILFTVKWQVITIKSTCLLEHCMGVVCPTVHYGHVLHYNQIMDGRRVIVMALPFIL